MGILDGVYNNANELSLKSFELNPFKTGTPPPPPPPDTPWQQFQASLGGVGPNPYSPSTYIHPGGRTPVYTAGGTRPGDIYSSSLPTRSQAGTGTIANPYAQALAATWGMNPGMAMSFNVNPSNYLVTDDTSAMYYGARSPSRYRPSYQGKRTGGPVTPEQAAGSFTKGTLSEYYSRLPVPDRYRGQEYTDRFRDPRTGELKTITSYGPSKRLYQDNFIRDPKTGKVTPTLSWGPSGLTEWHRFLDQPFNVSPVKSQLTPYGYTDLPYEETYTPPTYSGGGGGYGGPIEIKSPDPVEFVSLLSSVWRIPGR